MQNAFEPTRNTRMRPPTILLRLRITCDGPTARRANEGGHDTCGSRGGGRERVLHNNRFCVRLLENCCFGCLTLLLYTTQTSRYIMYIGFVCWVSLSTGIHVKLTFNKSLYHESKIALPFPLICLSLFGWLGLDLYMNQ
jgi:hypothetical protein